MAELSAKYIKRPDLSGAKKELRSGRTACATIKNAGTPYFMKYGDELVRLLLPLIILQTEMKNDMNKGGRIDQQKLMKVNKSILIYLRLMQEIDKVPDETRRPWIYYVVPSIIVIDDEKGVKSKKRKTT